MFDNPKIYTFIAAELIFILVRSHDILVTLKSKKQRTKDELHQVNRGLLRSLFLEAIFFVPASAWLLILIAPSLLPDHWFEENKIQALYSILGVASYGFPFTTIKRTITRLAFKTLLEFASLAPEEKGAISEEKARGQV